MANRSVIIRYEWKKFLKKLTQDQKGDFLDAVFDYMEGEDPETFIEQYDQAVGVAFYAAQERIDRDWAVLEKRVSHLRQYRDDTVTDPSRPRDDTVTACIPIPTPIPIPIPTNHRLEGEGKKPSFSPPTLALATDFFKENGGTEEQAKAFCDYYESNGWCVGKNRMKSWTAAARRWMGRDAERKSAPPWNERAKASGQVVDREEPSGRDIFAGRGSGFKIKTEE